MAIKDGDYHILSLGAGVQSTCVYLMGQAGEVPLTQAVFADTGDEPDEVYRHLQWLDNLHGIPIYIQSRGRLSDDLLHGKTNGSGRMPSIPAWTDTHGAKGRLRRQCTKDYKMEPFWQGVRYQVLNLKPRQRIPKDVHIHLYFGISADEARRTRGLLKHYQEKKQITVHFPLIMQGMTRNDCHRWMEGKVPHRVQRSACVYCPYHSDEEWQRLKQHDPRGWAKAVEVDEAMRNDTRMNRTTSSQLYLHQSLQPLSVVDFTNPLRTLPLFNFECLGLCGN